MLERTPTVLTAWLSDLSDEFVRATEGEGTWSPYDVIGHLIHGERADWIPRARHILAGETRPFDPFDREAQFAESAGKSLAQLLEEFTALRRESLLALDEFQLTENDLNRTGQHPAFGTVTLAQLLATWMVHDLDHLVQVARTIAKTQSVNVGPWTAYLSVLRDRR
jgi:uncharacterized damage-inducible protein DinB